MELYVLGLTAHDFLHHTLSREHELSVVHLELYNPGLTAHDFLHDTVT